MTFATEFSHCPYCGLELAGSRAAVVLGGSGDPSYVPFMEDWRGGPVDMAHPACFVERRGLDSFLDVLGRHDDWVRRSFFTYREKVRELETKLAAQHS